jgi:hypothetical protein
VRIENGEPIQSKLNTPAIIALHFLGAVNLNRVNSRESFHTWYKRSLFHFQSTLQDAYIDSLLDNILGDMVNRGMVKYDAEEDTIELRRRGLISCQMALDPYYMYDLIRNFKVYFDLIRADDAHLSNALASCGPFFKRPSKQSQEATPRAIQNITNQNYWETATVYYHLLRGEYNRIPGYMQSIKFQLIGDIDRVGQTLMRLNNETERWEQEEKIIAIAPRVRNGVDWKVGRLMGEGATKNQAMQLVSKDVYSMTLQRDPRYTAIFNSVMKSKWDEDF